MLDGFRAQKRMLRKEIRNYVVANQEDLEMNYGMKIPKDVKNMYKRDFEAWIDTICVKRTPKILHDLLVEYDCACQGIEEFSV